MNRSPMAGPQRIVCLTEETTETLYLLGEEARIVGISGFTVRPPQARKEKPKVSGFTSAKIDKILALAPDLVLGFSNLQADIAAALIRHGLAVHVFNQRSVEGIFDMIGLLGAMVGASARAEALVEQYRSNLKAVRNEGSRLPRRPRVYFEEWDNPLILGDPLGLGAHRHRRRRGMLSRADHRRVGQGPDHRRSERGRPPRPRHHYRLVVRQALSPRAGEGPRRLGRDPGGTHGTRLQDQVSRYPATWARRARRRACPDPSHNHALGRGE